MRFGSIAGVHEAGGLFVRLFFVRDPRLLSRRRCHRWARGDGCRRHVASWCGQLRAVPLSALIVGTSSGQILLLGRRGKQLTYQIGFSFKCFLIAGVFAVLAFLVEVVELLIGWLQPILQHRAGIEPVNDLVRVLARQPNLDC